MTSTSTEIPVSSGVAPAFTPTLTRSLIALRNSRPSGRPPPRARYRAPAIRGTCECSQDIVAAAAENWAAACASVRAWVTDRPPEAFENRMRDSTSSCGNRDPTRTRIVVRVRNPSPPPRGDFSRTGFRHKSSSGVRSPVKVKRPRVKSSRVPIRSTGPVASRKHRSQPDPHCPGQPQSPRHSASMPRPRT